VHPQHQKKQESGVCGLGTVLDVSEEVAESQDLPDWAYPFVLM